MINQSLHCFTQYPSKECASIETQAANVPSTEYADSWVRTNYNLFAVVANKDMENDNECHQFMGTLRETISFLKDEIKDKQVTINNLIDVAKNFTVNENKHKSNKGQGINVCRKGYDDVVGELLQVDQIHHRFHKLKSESQSSTDAPTTSVNYNQDRIQQNRAELGLTNNVKDKNINDQKSESSKISITSCRDHSDNDNDAPLDINKMFGI